MAYDSAGKERIEITGSWLSEYKIRDLATGYQETVWKEAAPIPDAHLQFFFNEVSMMMNDKNDNMKGVIAPTDSRWRHDMRLYEEGKIDESDQAKFVIEDLQRTQRKRREEGKLPPHKPLFFDEIDHPFITN